MSSHFTTLSLVSILLSLVAASPNGYPNGTSNVNPHGATGSLSGSPNATQPYQGNPDSVCYSYGVDFTDDGHYFINTLSNDDFTSVSTFEGCNQGLSEVLFVDPNGDEVLCSELPTTPDDTPQLSTCPLKKSQMFSGEYILLLFGNNGNGQPFAWERDLYLDCGPQVTTTISATATFNITSTPIITATKTSTDIFTSTKSNDITYTLPSKTAKNTKTVYPHPATVTKTKTLTQLRTTWTKLLSITTETATASCTTSAKQPDKPCTYSPTLLHPAAIVSPTSLPKSHRFARPDRVVDIEWARARIAVAKAKRNQKARSAAAPFDKRAPDAPTITVTAATPVYTTITYTGLPSTVIESSVLLATAIVTGPPVTVYSGILTHTTTASTPTVTRVRIARTTSVITKTIRATWTRTTTVTPSASMTACTRRGGHWGSGRW
jgi:hypothetical protein